MDDAKAPPSREHRAGLVDSLLLIVARVGSNLLSLAWTLLLVRMLAPQAAGVALQAISVAQIASILMTLNMESGAMRCIVPAREHGRMAQAAGFIRVNRRLVLFTLPLLALLGAAVWTTGLLPAENPQMLAAMALAMVLVALARLTARHATALGVMRKGLLPRLLTGPLVLTLGLSLAWAVGVPLKPWHVVVLFALSEGLTVLIQNALLRADFAFLRDTPSDSRAWRAWMGLGLWLTPGLVMTEYRKAILIATAGLALGGAQVSLFAVAFSIVNFINFGVVAVDVAFSPRIAQAMAADQPRRRDRLLASSAAIKLAGLALGVVIVLVLGTMALGWFGPEYRAAWPALLILLLIPALSVAFGPASAILASRGNGRADFAGNLTGALACLVAVPALGALYGVTGAAAGAVASHGLGLAVMNLLCRRRLGIDPSLASLRHLAGSRARPGAQVAP